MTLAGTLAGFAATLEFGDLPLAVVASGKLRALDALAHGLDFAAGRREPHEVVPRVIH